MTLLKLNNDFLCFDLNNNMDFLRNYVSGKFTVKSWILAIICIFEALILYQYFILYFESRRLHIYLSRSQL